ncbi:oligosaccharide flippase family protein [Arachidicoccus soli]|uniref:Polysaccharide biosynthesis protein C-terminal domain-containing protein n=1 Tax=Arachidicoccus soli TaxID=2341117 RepID=A0A386HPW5_9BACT|nr:oligosaccharide flippase family protein [Arachidicoccus soli]AYD47987.1 hypothetical protein D6B99_10525 [Arachidicoccus soli]
MKKNIIANIVGKGWSLISNFVFIPLYIYFLGIQSYSIISFTLIIVGLMAMLDAGMTATLSREFAIKTNSKKDLVKILSTLETCYFFIAIIIIGLIYSFAGVIAKNMLNDTKYSNIELIFYLRIIGIGVAFQMLAQFYMGGLLGLEKQVKANFYQILWSIARNALVIIPIYYFRSLSAFFLWQISCTIIYAVTLRMVLIRNISRDLPFFIKPRIDNKVIKRVWKFAAGMLLISLVASVNTQLDKLTISKVLPIDQLGYYTIAMTLTYILMTLINPVDIAIRPRFTALFSENKLQDVLLLYNKLILFISIVIFSIAAILFFNSKEIILIWMRKESIVDKSYMYVPVLTLGMCALTSNLLPFNICLSLGKTKLNNIVGIFSLFLTIPGYWIFTRKYGALGAAVTWTTVQIIITPIYFYYVNKFYIKDKHGFKTFLQKIIYPGLVAFGLGFIFSRIPFSKSIVLVIFQLAFSAFIILFILLKCFLAKADISGYLGLFKFQKK